MHVDAAGLVLASSRLYEDGADLARGCGILGIFTAVLCLLTAAFSRDGFSARMGGRILGRNAGQALVISCIMLAVAGVGLVMMAVGSG